MSVRSADLRSLAELLAPAFQQLVPLEARAGLPAIAAAPTVDELASWLGGLTSSKLESVLEPLNHPRVIAIRAALGGSVAAPSSSAPHRILTGLPVVDRLNVWSRLQALHTGTSRILKVRGERGAGKSYTKWLVMEFCQRLGANHEALHPFDLDGYHKLEAIADDLLTALGAAGTLRRFDDMHTTERAWARGVAQQVFQRLKTPGPARWLVFDHFERTTRSDAAIAFFLYLAEQVAVHAALPTAPRLILIDHGVDVPPIARGVTVEENVEPATATDIALFVRTCRPQWSPSELDDEVKRIVGVLTRQDTFMEDLNAEVGMLCK